MGLREDLVAARALIDTPENWKQSAGNNGDDTPCCAVVAANRVAYYPSERNATMRSALWDALPEEYQEGGSLYGYDVGRFNDDPSTTHNDVLALFDRAIAAAKPA